MKIIRDLSVFIINSDASILSAVERLTNKSDEQQFLLVVDNSMKLVGTLTDGDIRRALISGYSMRDSVINFMNANPQYIKVPYQRAVLEKRFKNQTTTFRFIPACNEISPLTTLQ